MDFDDLLLKTNELLNRFPDVLAKYQTLAIAKGKSETFTAIAATGLWKIGFVFRTH